MGRISLNEAKQKFLEFYQSENRMPSYQEICEIFDYQSKNAAFRLVKKLVDADILAKSSGGRLVPKNLSGLRVLGTVQAGFPTPAEEDLLDTISLDEYLVSNPQATFLVKVSGDSMIEGGIHPGDLVLVDRGRSPRNGDVVLAQIDNEWTLKFFDKKGQKVRLVPGNAKYPVLEPKMELKIGGVITGSVRKYY